MGSHSVTCHPAEVTFPPLSIPAEAGTRFSDPKGRKAELTWVVVTSRDSGTTGACIIPGCSFTNDFAAVGEKMT